MFLEQKQRMGTPAARGAVHHVAFGFIKRLDPVLEIGGLKIDVLRAGDSSRTKFAGRSNIQNNYFFVRHKVLRLFCIDMLDDGFRFGRGVRCNGRGTNDERCNQGDDDEGLCCVHARRVWLDHCL